ncbi:MAG: hypothetical protein KDD94_08580, partial [Calditrichaeota bacterium]|nr:hypothetical protein [Calditrichota bacterium]
MTNEQFEELCSAYVLKSLNQNETDEFKKYLETANENEREFYKQALNCSLQLPLSATSAEPSQLVKNKILSQVDTSRRSTSIFPLRYILYSAAAVLIAILSLNLFSSNPVPVENHLLENGVMLISHEAQLPSSFCHSAKNISLVSADGKSESAKLIWCDFHRISYLQINEMSDLEAGESYQLWIS